jgi:hypothetical protein
MLLVLSTVAIAAAAIPSSSTDFALNRISKETYPHAKCLDGSSPAYYWRPGTGADVGKSLIIFLQGGGWCYPSDIQQPCEPSSSHCSANCHIRANLTSTGSTKGLQDVVAASALEGGTGYISGNASRVGAPYHHSSPPCRAAIRLSLGMVLCPIAGWCGPFAMQGGSFTMQGGSLQVEFSWGNG